VLHGLGLRGQGRDAEARVQDRERRLDGKLAVRGVLGGGVQRRDGDDHLRRRGETGPTLDPAAGRSA